jgi:hypothetical protein
VIKYSVKVFIGTGRNIVAASGFQHFSLSNTEMTGEGTCTIKLC